MRATLRNATRSPVARARATLALPTLARAAAPTLSALALTAGALAASASSLAAQAVDTPTGGAEADWELSPVRHVHWLGDLGAWFLAALTLFLIVKAVLRAGRYRAVSVFDEPARERVRAAVAAAELKTTGEIVPVIVERSDPHPAAEWKSALAFLLLGSALLAPWLPWESPFLLLASQLGLGGAGYALAVALPDLKRLFVFETRATLTSEEQALQEFAREGLAGTVAATGVLIFVSLFERRVIVLADKAIAAKVSDDAWDRIDAHVLDGVVRGELADGLCKAIEETGTLLAEHFPWVEGDRNELPDRVVVRRE